MSTITLSTSAWTSVTTTTADTVFQNKSASPVYVTTESTAGLDLSDGFYLGPDQGIVVSSGQTVSAVSFGSPAELFYMGV